MQIRGVSKLAVQAAFGLLSAVCAGAATVYDTPADSAGGRTVLAMTLTAPAGLWPTAEVQWQISEEGQWLRYTYIITGVLQPAIGHFTLEAPDDCASDSACIVSAQLREDVDDILVNINPALISFGGMNGIGSAVKFDIGESEPENGFVSYTFLSNRAPVWGNLYFKAGQAELTNVGFNDVGPGSVLDYVARPGSASLPADPASVPEPNSVWMLGPAIAAVAMFRRWLI